MNSKERECVDLAEIVIAIFGSKWKPAIIWCLVFQGRMRFNQLRRAIPDITQKMLTQRLREMERDGLVTRTFYEQIPPRVEYEATNISMALHPVFSSICDWGNSSLPIIRKQNARYDHRKGT